MGESTVEFVEESDEESVLDVSVKPRDVSSAVVHATDWTTETILSQFRRGNININPRFQRRDAWNITKKSRFIESIILGLPLPQIVLAEDKNARGKYLVLDGKQRLLTLLQFTGYSEEGRFKDFKLRHLEVRLDLNGKSFKDLDTDPQLKEDLNQFYNQSIRSAVIRNWPNEDFLHLVFVRLNTGTVQLSPQELRQALFPGEFVSYIDEAASDSSAIRSLLKNSDPDFRMRDVELLLRHLAFKFFISDYSGDLKKFLDKTCETLNDNWIDKEGQIKEQVEKFDQSINAAIDIFGKDNVGRKWIGVGFEPRLNRAVLDVITFYLSDDIIRSAALENSGNVLKAFQDLCMEDETFRNSIETTTKSLGATSNRLILWGKRLRDVVGLDFATPDLENNAINFSGFWR